MKRMDSLRLGLLLMGVCFAIVASAHPAAALEAQPVGQCDGVVDTNCSWDYAGCDGSNGCDQIWCTAYVSTDVLWLYEEHCVAVY
jgi:hypothetical protein